MKRIAAMLSALALATVSLCAQGLDEQYVRVYNLIQEADAAVSSGQTLSALPKYLEAQTTLKRIQQSSPEWNPRVVNYRLSYVEVKITALKSKAPSTEAPTTAPDATKPAASLAEQQVADLSAQVQSLQASKLILEAKLKEALATRPAAIDPRELAKAEDRIRDLSKENELIKASLEAEKRKSGTDTGKQLDSARAELAEANRKLAEQIQVSKTLNTENSGLQQRVKQLASAADTVEALRQENALLKRQAADAKANRPAGRSAETEKQLTDSEARYAALKSDFEILRLEKIALQNRIQTMTNQLALAARTPPDSSEDQKKIRQLEVDNQALKNQLAVSGKTVVVATNRPEDAARIRQLEAERDDLKQKLAAAPTATGPRPEDLVRIKSLEKERDDLRHELDAANRRLATRESREASAKIEQLTGQIETLRARLQVYEARSTPYTAEELALFKLPAQPVVPRDANAGKVSSRALPSGTTGLAAEAQRYFANASYDKAETVYQEMLKKDDKNAFALANLASAQLQQDKLDDAAKNARAALASSPNDAFALSILGLVCIKQEKWDDALDALSKSAKADPENANVQNYLGIALAQKGLRGPAEAAFRKAVTIEPNHGSAHHNLAVYYLTKDTMSLPLAQWHYKRAIDNGYPHDPELEKAIADKAPLKAP